TGNKAMIENGRITPFRFDGERDPMEQRYDLRAVSFCRYGSGYVHKASPVISGIKDTRPPVVFGEPEPANSILGVGDHLKLRFNESIAGNYLDEDNNFQITGVTNDIGLAASTALHFDANASAYTKAKRDLTDKSFTIDLMILPTESNRTQDMILFETGTKQSVKQFILTHDNRLKFVNMAGEAFVSQSSRPIGDILSFVRVLFVYDNNKHEMRFYAGNEDVTDNTLGDSAASNLQSSSAYFKFGDTYDGDMLEARIWTKALTLEEITATADHSLTGYERELLAYYRMNEGKGETITDMAHGATLYLDGCSWNKQKGFSLQFDGSQEVKLDGNLLGRSDVYDETIMFWFKAKSNGTLFSANRQEALDSIPAKGTLIALEDGKLVLYSGENSYVANDQFADDAWHHLVLAINRTYNNASLFVDNKLYQSFAAVQLEGIIGAMYLGGNGFKGDIDEFVIFEQSLPKSLVELYGDNALAGDEMGLMAYLPFEEQYLNPSGVLQQRFSVNDQRVFKDANGDVVDKVVPLVDETTVEQAMINENNAPVKSHGLLNKLYFNWSFNNDELMINILNRDYEVNKQSIYVTVRDVEDLNGNPMISPATWTAFVDRNSLKWSSKQLSVKSDDGTEEDQEMEIRIINNSGKRHTYTIESLPSWLEISTQYGTIDPMGEQNVLLTFSSQAPVGEYSDILYLTDEDGLAEPLQIEYIIEAIPPYEDVDESKYALNMSLCGKVQINTDDGISYDTDERDIVYALYRNECVGMAYVAVDAVSNTTDVYLTILGNEDMHNAPIRFQLWQASTGKIYDLSADRNILFGHGHFYGCGTDGPVILNASGRERQQICLKAGWNWMSVNLDLKATKGNLATCMSAAQPWTNGDVIKNPSARQFSSYDEVNDVFAGTLKNLHFSQMYMVYSANGNTMRVSGETLPADSMHVTVRGNGQWSPLPCMFNQRTSITEALADYYQNASVGDIVKAHNHFATFTSDGRWVGDLQTLQPGEGYLFLRMAQGDVEISFYGQAGTQNAPERRNTANAQNTQTFSNPNAATNMTMIAKIEGTAETNRGIEVYVGKELVSTATPIRIDDKSLYFLTIQSDKSGELKFEANGTQLFVEGNKINYKADNHYGSVSAPVILTTECKDTTGVYKVIEDQHVVIIRNNEKYDVTGKKL
ncbi:MAG: hypothetical protein J6W92_02360, partial [Paludibacteraceae bacterium]|nr:hypothetical protein [Paludibacteraceae bacterium]